MGGFLGAQGTSDVRDSIKSCNLVASRDSRAGGDLTYKDKSKNTTDAAEVQNSRTFSSKSGTQKEKKMKRYADKQDNKTLDIDQIFSPKNVDQEMMLDRTLSEAPIDFKERKDSTQRIITKIQTQENSKENQVSHSST